MQEPHLTLDMEYDLCDYDYLLGNGPALPTIETLPPELFNMIMEYTGLFAHPDRLIVVYGAGRKRDEAPPAVCRVNRYFRAQTIGAYFEPNRFLFWFVAHPDISFNIQKCVEWLSSVGGVGDAAILRNVQIVYTRKRHLRRMHRDLFPQMYSRGVKSVGNLGVVQLQRVPIPSIHFGKELQRILDDLGFLR